MARRKIAAFANGWNETYFSLLIDGMMECVNEEQADLFIFLSNASGNGNNENDHGEYNIFNLPELGSFDGALFFSNLIYIDEVRETLRRRIVDRGIPNVTFLDASQELDYVGSDNYNGMRELAEHLVKVHGVKTAVYLGGPADNLENQKRLNGARDVFAENGLPFPDENVFFGDWYFYTAQILARKIIDSFHPLPDAFFCANDISALAVCDTLKKNGIRVPDDVLVVGFDHVPDAQCYYPAITSVERGWAHLGKITCQRLLDKIDGKPLPKKAFYPSHLAVEESCGCRTTEKQDACRRFFSNQTVISRISGMQFEWALWDIEKVLNDTERVEDLPEAAELYYKMHRGIAGGNISIVIDRSFFESVHSTDEVLRTDGYSKDMQIILHAEDGITIKGEEFTELVPGYDPENGGHHTYLFMPLHYHQYVFGYLVLRDRLDLQKDGTIYYAASRINEYLERFRKTKKMELMNRQLVDLYTRDALTGLYNRLGLEQLALPLLQKNRRSGRNSVLFFADINRMKVINDRFGHLQGDLAIRAIADSLRETFPSEWPVCRFGGDEFLVIGTCESGEQAEKYIAGVRDTVRSKAERLALPYSLAASIGYTLIAPDSQKTIEDFISDADHQMYEHKKAWHEGNDVSGTPTF